MAEIHQQCHSIQQLKITYFRVIADSTVSRTANAVEVRTRSASPLYQSVEEDVIEPHMQIT
jgi:hypothetical protein